MVSPFVDTMKRQVTHREDIWGTRANAILPVAKWSWIKAPLSAGLVPNRKHATWHAAMEDMARQIIAKRPEVVLVGAGAFSLPLC